MKNKFNIEIITPNSDNSKTINNYIWYFSKKELPNKNHILYHNTNFNIIKSRCIGIEGDLFGIILRIK